MSFLYLIITAYLGMNIYLARELLTILGIQSIKLKVLYYLVYFSTAMSYFISRTFFTTSANDFTDFLGTWAGNAMPTTFYAFLLIMLYKIIKVAYYQLIHSDLPLPPKVAFYILLLLLLALNIRGYYNATEHTIMRYDIQVDKTIPTDNVRIVVASDLHLGKITDRAYLERFVQKVNAQQPDLVFLLGDTVDSDWESVERKKLFEPFQDIRSKYGLYAVLGNHEYIAKAPLRITKMLNDHHVHTLVDHTIYIEQLNLALIGLNDIGNRKPDTKDAQTLQMLLQKNPPNSTSIMLDHQPKRIEIATEQGIDLTLSGHTHKGQFFPLNFVTKLIFLNDWGWKKFNNTHSLVSCGYGNWGAQMRLGSNVELVVINLHGTQKDK